MTFSIITINFNNKDGLRRTIISVIEQTWHDFEFIVIDGKSTDGSLSVIKEYENHIDYWVSESDKGVYNAMNKGIKQAHGVYLIFMNSGDTFYAPSVLKSVIPYLNSDIIEGRLFKMTTQSYTKLPSHKPTMMLFYEGGLDHQACFIKRDLFKNTLYNENLKIAADWEFFLQKVVFENYTLTFMPIVVASYEGGGISEDKEHELLHKAERTKILAKSLPPLILADYERFANKESPVIDLIPSFNKTYRLQKLIICFIKIVTNIRNSIIYFRK